METTKKQYGLIIPKKEAPVTPSLPVKKPSVFNDSDSDDEAPGDWMQKTLQKEKYGGARSRHSKAEIERVLKEDPTAYQYDEVYDQMERTRNETLAAKKLERTERKPKYVQHLMATAERRKKENERRIARQVQKEREAEGDEFADKEVFVTSAYKKKLEEMKAAEEKEKEEDRLEEIGDVTKQRDLGGFYRHLYERVVLDDSGEGSVTKIIVDSDDEETVDSKGPSKTREKKTVSKAARQYRKRKSDSEPSDDETSAKSTVKRRPPSKVQSNKKSKEEDNPKETSAENKEAELVSENTENPDADSASSGSENESESENKTNEDKKDEGGEVQNGENTNEDTPPQEKPPKRSIWEKRTVGEAFDDALQRYYERKANRLTAQGN